MHSYWRSNCLQRHWLNEVWGNVSVWCTEGNKTNFGFKYFTLILINWWNKRMLQICTCLSCPTQEKLRDFKGIINHNLLSSENPGTIMLAMLKKGSFTWTDGRLNEDREGGPGRWMKEKRVEIQMDEWLWGCRVSGLSRNRGGWNSDLGFVKRESVSLASISLHRWLVWKGTGVALMRSRWFY